MGWKLAFVGLAAFGLIGMVAYVITAEAWFLIAPLGTVVGLQWWKWSLNRQIAALKRRLDDVAR